MRVQKNRCFREQARGRHSHAKSASKQGKSVSEIPDDDNLIIASDDLAPSETVQLDKNKIIVLNDVRDAYPFIGSLTGKKDVYALFENDLPDTYNE